jgi:hypothetical protein
VPVFTLLIGVLVLCAYAAGSANNGVLEATTATTTQSYTYGWEIEPLFNPPRERLPTINQLKEALSWIVDTDKCEAPINAVFIPLSAHYNGMGAWDFYITDDLKINISSGEVAKLVDVLDLYTGQRLMVYFKDIYMVTRLLWMIELTHAYDGFIYARVNESMLEQGYIFIEDFYWRDVRTTYRSPNDLVDYLYGNTTYYCPARYNVTWRNAVQVWRVYNLALPWRPWGLATTVTATETVTTTETTTQTTTETTTLPPITITTTTTETATTTATQPPETTTITQTTTTTQHQTTTETVTAWETAIHTSVKTETTTERETHTTTATIARAPVETVAAGALGALIGALIMALLLRKTQ